jgi:hypothetical protein
LANGGVSIALAQHVVHHVWMSNVTSALTRMRILGNDFKCRRTSMQRPGPVELDLERTKVNSLELNWLRGNGHAFAAKIEADLRELLFKGLKIAIDLIRREDVVSAGSGAI